MITTLVTWLMLLIGAPLLHGVINRTKAVMAGRRGPALLQQYFDLVKLLRKDFVVSSTTTWVFLAGPVVGISAGVVGSLLLPLGGRAWVSFTGDMILFIYVFALARFFVAAAAMDTGSAFEGMGAAREVTFAALAEPALLFGMIAFARLSDSLTLSQMLDLQSAQAWQKGSASIVLIVVSWFIVLLAENSRLPFDDPNTHLELTMIHEVMVLDHGGPAFGLVLYSAALKMMVFTALLVTIVLPMRSGNAVLDFVLFVAGIGAVGIAVGLIESSMARLRLLRVPQLLITATLLAAFAVVLLLR